MTAPQSLSAERREEVRQLWCENGGWFDEVDDAVMRGPDFWCFWAALDAQHAERTRAEVEKMREAAATLAASFLTGPICPYGNDKRGDPTWNHTDNDICPVCKKNGHDSAGHCVQNHSGRIAAAIHALSIEGTGQ